MPIIARNQSLSEALSQMTLNWLQFLVSSNLRRQFVHIIYRNSQFDETFKKLFWKISQNVQRKTSNYILFEYNFRWQLLFFQFTEFYKFIKFVYQTFQKFNSD